MYLMSSNGRSFGRRFGSFLAFVSLLSTTRSDYLAFQQNGRTKLLGTSFGGIGGNATFDYVIIGGGTAGLTIAERLSKQPGVSVAVVEGGSFYELNNGNLSQIPAYDTYYTLFPPSLAQPLIDWGFVTVPQPQLDGRIIDYAQGKCLGGGSARNYMVYQRGTTGAYQQWADQVGDQSYTFKNILPFFQKSAHLTPPNPQKRGNSIPVSYDPSAFSSSGGPLQVSYSNYYQPITTGFRNAFNSLGYKSLAGANSGSLLGFTELTFTVDPQAATRSSSESSFLQQALLSSPLIVYQNTLAQKINFDGNKKATGVSVSTADIPYTLSARKEVIVSAGAFRSPQMLMVSGIGPAATLQGLGIPVLSNLPGVGQNLHDNPFYGVTYQTNVTTASALSNPAALFEATDEYLTSQTGQLVSDGANLAGWLKIPASDRKSFSKSTSSYLATYPADWPEVQIIPFGAPFAPIPPTDTNNYLAVSVAVTAFSSRGNVTIKSASTTDNPIVSPNYLLTPEDQQLAVAGLRQARDLASKSGIIVGQEYAPGPNVTTDAEILAYIQEAVMPLYHASCTCAMGKQGDPNAVVDSTGKVFGVSGVRVVDVSAFPLLPPGQPQATVYMLAEKIASDIINGL